MKHFDILKRAWKITWGYKALWIFGILMALLAGTGGNGGSGSSSSSGNWSSNGGMGSLSSIPMGLIIVIVVLILIFAFLFLIAATIGRYLGENALIKMVNDFEEEETRYSLQEGFRLGWSPSAGRIFLLDLVVGIPFVILIVVSLLLVGAPLLLWVTDNMVAGITGTVISVGLLLVLFLVLLILGSLLSLLQHFFRRVCVLEAAGVLAALQRGAELAFQNFKDVFLMGLLMFGINFVSGLGILAAFFCLLLLALLLSGLPALLAGGLTALLFNGAIPWVMGLLVFLPSFFVLAVFPSLLIQGVLETFKSTVWTLVYRELQPIAAE